MLVVSRCTDQRIMIGDDIVITIVAIRDNKVRLGFEAPIDTPIHREEVYESIKKHGRTKDDLAK